MLSYSRKYKASYSQQCEHHIWSDACLQVRVLHWRMGADTEAIITYDF